MTPGGVGKGGIGVRMWRPSTSQERHRCAGLVSTMVISARVCSLLLALTSLVSAQSAGLSVVVAVSPVVLTAAPFSVELTLPPSLALRKGGVEAQVCIVNQEGEEKQLLKRKLSVASRGGVMLQHELEGLLIGCVGRGAWVQSSNIK